MTASSALRIRVAKNLMISRKESTSMATFTCKQPCKLKKVRGLSTFVDGVDASEYISAIPGIIVVVAEDMLGELPVVLCIWGYEQIRTSTS